MRIAFKLDDFLYTIFPDVHSEDQLVARLTEYYANGANKPKVTIEDGWVIINFETAPVDASETAEYKRTLALCEKGRYAEAKKNLEGLIQKNSTQSEYHRIYGQILSDEGDQDGAINSLIDALRWNPGNGFALLMMGNIFAKFKNDVPTAMKYYDQALKVNPKDHITMNNIGANLMQQNKFAEGKKYFLEALKINDQYPNTHFALGMIADIEGDLPAALQHSVNALKLCAARDALYHNSVRQAFEIAQKTVELGEEKKIVREFLHKLEFEGGTLVDSIADQDIPTAAKIEFAENYGRDKHVIRYKPGYPAVDHLIMHELSHLRLVIEARKTDQNLLFTATQEHRQKFLRNLEPTVRKLHKMGVPEKNIASYCNSLFDGFNSQIFNAPIDLFIEDFLYREFPQMRAYQLLSLFNIVKEGIKAVTDKTTVEVSPKSLISQSKTYNIVGALQFRDLYGIDLLKEFQATPSELKQAGEFYDEYLEYKEDKKPAEEYELMLHWAEDLKVDQYFELVNETEYRTKRTDIDNMLESIENDPYDLESKDPYKEREMKKFQTSQREIGTNMAVVMYMVDALQYFDGMQMEEVRKIAYEIALQGTQGYRPDKDNYTLASIPEKKFSGYHILAYYYVSWALAVPEMLSGLHLPYEEEYQVALTMFKPRTS